MRTIDNIQYTRYSPPQIDWLTGSLILNQWFNWVRVRAYIQQTAFRCTHSTSCSATFDIIHCDVLYVFAMRVTSHYFLINRLRLGMCTIQQTICTRNSILRKQARSHLHTRSALRHSQIRSWLTLLRVHLTIWYFQSNCSPISIVSSELIGKS